MSVTTENSTEFTNVDRAADANWFVNFMDLANGLGEYAAIRRCLAELAGPLEGSAVLDVGCGTGDDARELAGMVGDGRVVGVDLSEVMIETARTRSADAGLPVEFTQGDLRALPFADGTFGAARGKLVLGHCPDVPGAVAEIVRVTASGGRIAMFEYDYDTLTVDHPDRPTTLDALHCWAHEHATAWSGRQLRRRLEDAGCTDLRVVPHTVLMPFEFFAAAVAGKLRSAMSSGSLRWSKDDLDAWWQPLTDAEAQGRFFATITGFAVGGRRA
jgi:ubiquinone/menaquinone biosynthesis C-methylase UbiE